MIGFGGAHRTGKSTLARAVAPSLHLPVIESRAGEVIRELGIDMAADLSLKERISVQELILDAAIDDYKRHAGSFISDRTPLDMAAYILADCLKNSGTAEEQRLAVAYVERCIDVTNKNFTCLILVKPGIPYVVEANKPPPSVAYQEHHGMLVQGLVNDLRVLPECYEIPRRALALEERTQIVLDIWSDLSTTAQKHLKHVTCH